MPNLSGQLTAATSDASIAANIRVLDSDGSDVRAEVAQLVATVATLRSDVDHQSQNADIHRWALQSFTGTLPLDVLPYAGTSQDGVVTSEKYIQWDNSIDASHLHDTPDIAAEHLSLSDAFLIDDASIAEGDGSQLREIRVDQLDKRWDQRDAMDDFDNAVTLRDGSDDARVLVDHQSFVSVPLDTGKVLPTWEGDKVGIRLYATDLSNDGTYEVSWGDLSAGQQTLPGALDGANVILETDADNPTTAIGIRVSGDTNKSARIDIYSKEQITHPIHVFDVVDGHLVVHFRRGNTNSIHRVALPTASTPSHTESTGTFYDHTLDTSAQHIGKYQADAGAKPLLAHSWPLDFNVAGEDKSISPFGQLSVFNRTGPVADGDAANSSNGVAFDHLGQDYFVSRTSDGDIIFAPVTSGANKRIVVTGKPAVQIGSPSATYMSHQFNITVAEQFYDGEVERLQIPAGGYLRVFDGDIYVGKIDAAALHSAHTSSAGDDATANSVSLVYNGRTLYFGRKITDQLVFGADPAGTYDITVLDDIRAYVPTTNTIMPIVGQSLTKHRGVNYTVLSDTWLFQWGAADIAVNAIGTGQIQDASVTQNKLANNSVGTAQVRDGEVTQPKLAHNSVGTAQIEDAAVTQAKLAPSVLGHIQSEISVSTFGTTFPASPVNHQVFTLTVDATVATFKDEFGNDATQGYEYDRFQYLTSDNHWHRVLSINNIRPYDWATKGSVLPVDPDKIRVKEDNDALAESRPALSFLYQDEALKFVTGARRDVSDRRTGAFTFQHGQASGRLSTDENDKQFVHTLGYYEAILRDDLIPSGVNSIKVTGMRGAGVVTTFTRDTTSDPAGLYSNAYSLWRPSPPLSVSNVPDGRREITFRTGANAAITWRDTYEYTGHQFRELDFIDESAPPPWPVWAVDQQIDRNSRYWFPAKKETDESPNNLSLQFPAYQARAGVQGTLTIVVHKTVDGDTGVEQLRRVTFYGDQHHDETLRNRYRFTQKENLIDGFGILTLRMMNPGQTLSQARSYTMQRQSDGSYLSEVIDDDHASDRVRAAGETKVINLQTTSPAQPYIFMNPASEINVAVDSRDLPFFNNMKKVWEAPNTVMTRFRGGIDNRWSSDEGVTFTIDDISWDSLVHFRIKVGTATDVIYFVTIPGGVIRELQGIPRDSGGHLIRTTSAVPIQEFSVGGGFVKYRDINPGTHKNCLQFNIDIGNRRNNFYLGYDAVSKKLIFMSDHVGYYGTPQSIFEIWI